MPPVYEYRCNDCEEVRTSLRPVSERKRPLLLPCVNSDDLKPGSAIQCKLKRILSPTPTTFRFNDRIGYKGLDNKLS